MWTKFRKKKQLNKVTYADILRPSERVDARKYDIGLIVGGSLFVALCAQISFHIPFNPVPITGQTLGVLLVGVLLGSNRGALAILTYLAEGSAGLPFFAGGSSGFPYMIGPTGGYLLGFVLAAFIVGKLAEIGWDKRVITVIPVMVLGTIVIFAAGLLWLTKFVGSANVLAMGFYPFVPGALLKISIATILLPAGWKFMGRK